MSIDSRLAHGIARTSFQSIVQFGSGLHNLLMHFHHRKKTPVSTPKGGRKLIEQVRRYILICAFWMAEEGTNREGPAIHWLYFLPFEKDGSVELAAARYAPLNRHLLLVSKPLAIIKKHAIARAHQRLDEIEWSEISREFSFASLMLAPMAKVAKKLELKQVFLTTRSGILVGEVRADGLLQLNTYLHNNRLSLRWQQVTQAAMDAMESCGSDKDALVKKLTDALMYDGDPGLDDVVSALVTTLDQPRFSWLKRTYEQGEDVRQTIWDSAKAQISDEIT